MRHDSRPRCARGLRQARWPVAAGPRVPRRASRPSTFGIVGARVRPRSGDRPDRNRAARRGRHRTLACAASRPAAARAQPGDRLRARAPRGAAAGVR